MPAAFSKQAAWLVCGAGDPTAALGAQSKTPFSFYRPSQSKPKRICSWMTQKGKGASLALTQEWVKVSLPAFSTNSQGGWALGVQQPLSPTTLTLPPNTQLWAPLFLWRWLALLGVPYFWAPLSLVSA